MALAGNDDPPCGPVSRVMVDLISGAVAEPFTPLPATAILSDRDVQLAWWMAYELCLVDGCVPG